MKMKLVDDCGKLKRGDLVEVVRIKYDFTYKGNFKVRVVGAFSNPAWVSIMFLDVKAPKNFV